MEYLDILSGIMENEGNARFILRCGYHGSISSLMDLYSTDYIRFERLTSLFLLEYGYYY